MNNRDLDIRVAKEVMDWTGIHSKDILTGAIDPLFGYPPIDPRQPEAYGILHHLPYYTEYLPAAWGIVEYLQNKYRNLTWQSSGDLGVSLEWMPNHKVSNVKIKFMFYIAKPYKSGNITAWLSEPISDEAEAETLPMAICLAALTIKNVDCNGICFQKQKVEEIK